MTWYDDQYQRQLLDNREKWGTVLSLTAVVGAVVFLADHEHLAWLKLTPLLIGLFGSLYVLVVDSYYEQAEAFANARNSSNAPDNSEADKVRSAKWFTFIPRIGILGWLNILAPGTIGMLGTLALAWGFK